MMGRGVLTVFEAGVDAADRGVVPHHVGRKVRDGAARGRGEVVWGLEGRAPAEGDGAEAGIVVVGWGGACNSEGE